MFSEVKTEINNKMITKTLFYIQKLENFNLLVSV